MFRKLTAVMLVLAALLVAIGSPSQQVLADGSAVNKPEGGGPTILRLDFTPPMGSTRANLFYKGVGTDVESSKLGVRSWRVDGVTTSRTPITATATGANVIDGAPFPEFLGMDVAFQTGTGNQFLGAAWYPTHCDVPTIKVAIHSPRTSASFANVQIDNRGSQKLWFTMDNGGTWIDLQGGDFFTLQDTSVGKVHISTSLSIDPGSFCGFVGWDVRVQNTEGKDPTVKLTKLDKWIPGELGKLQVDISAGDYFVDWRLNPECHMAIPTFAGKVEPGKAYSGIHDVFVFADVTATTCRIVANVDLLKDGKTDFRSFAFDFPIDPKPIG